MNVSTVSFALISWKVRGLGDKDKCTIVHDTLDVVRPTIACLQESKLDDDIDPSKLRSFLPRNLSESRSVGASASCGGLITSWDPHVLTLTSFATRNRSLTTFFSSTTSDYSFAITNVYAPADHRDSITFLEDLEKVTNAVSGDWALVGDFILTLSEEDNSNGSVNVSLAEAFSNTIDRLALQDIPLLDRLFTWSNHRYSPTLARLDRVFFNTSMSLTFPNSSLTSLPKTTSDHVPPAPPNHHGYT
jgi:exonuclease III